MSLNGLSGLGWQDASRSTNRKKDTILSHEICNEAWGTDERTSTSSVSTLSGISMSSTQIVACYEKPSAAQIQRGQRRREAILDHYVFDKRVEVHTSLEHAGKNKIFADINEKYYNISRGEVKDFMAFSEYTANQC